MKNAKRLCRFIIGIALLVLSIAALSLISAHYWVWGIWVAYFIVVGISVGAGIVAWLIDGTLKSNEE